jgi:tRNA(Ile)-lysidine synthase
MLSRFITYIQKHDIFRLSGDKILLAVSGGIDSIALLGLCKHAGVKFGIAHCNFQLRGNESDNDEAFVKALARDLKIPFYCKRFDIDTEVTKDKKSTQMSARDLRYEWFELLRVEKGYQYIAVAHHHNDSIETLMLNLIKGCGIRGLHGILPKNGKIIRPLLFANRIEIEDYVSRNELVYREDSSNADTKYTRNALRHLIIPEMQKINPDLEKTFQENFKHFRETELLYKYAIEQFRKELVHQKGDQTWIDIEGVASSPAPFTLLFELLAPFNFKSSKIQCIYKSRNEDSGVIFSSKTHLVLRDRTHWIVSAIPECKNERFQIDKLTGEQGKLNNDNLIIEWKIIKAIANKTDNDFVCFDLDKLEFPLHLRHWKAGDVIYPKGMDGHKKKLSKFFKDIKMNRFDKDSTWLLCNAKEEVIWIIGHREDERFKVEEQTTKVLQLLYKEL